jgi:hypothetical protein
LLKPDQLLVLHPARNLPKNQCPYSDLLFRGPNVIADGISVIAFVRPQESAPLVLGVAQQTAILDHAEQFVPYAVGSRAAAPGESVYSSTGRNAAKRAQKVLCRTYGARLHKNR